MEINDIIVPRFTYGLLAQKTCEKCEESLENAWVTAAGVAMDSDNQPCFFVRLRCRHCEASRSLVVTDRRVQSEEWWIDYGRWCAEVGPLNVNRRQS